jgi:DNA (cytosine-5)-methyltransferase 1
METERLQGFPDEWTKYRLNEKGEIVEQADSARYKQMGNAVTIPVVEWIMSRLVEVDERTKDN